MAADTLLYQGINRAITDYSGARACEELINLRPTTEGLVPVKPFSVKKANIDWAKIFVHHSTDGDKYFIVRKNAGSVSVHLLDANLDPLAALFSIPTSAETAEELAALQDRVVEAVSFAAAGNVVLFSVCDVEDAVYENHSYIWKESSYVPNEATIPNVSIEVGMAGTTIQTVSQDIPTLNAESTTDEVISAVENALNAVQEKNPKLCLGPIIVAFAYKTTDGSTFWTNNWVVYDPVPDVDSALLSPRVTISDFSGSLEIEMRSFFVEYGYGYALVPQTQAYNIDAVSVSGTHVDVTLGQINTDQSNPDWDKETSMIQSIEVYSSRPRLYLDASKAKDGFECIVDTHNTPQACLVLPQYRYRDMELDSQLMYLQSSVTLESLTEGDQVVHLEFGGNQQVVEETLKVDTGEQERYGKLLSYNARFHFFKSVSALKIGMPSFDYGGDPSGRAFIFAEYTDEERSVTKYLGYLDTLAFNDDAKVVIAPSLRIKEVVAYFLVGSSGSGTTWYTTTYRMKESMTYNYSVCTGDVAYDSGSGTNPKYSGLIPADPSIPDNSIVTEEKAAINVTEQYNPFVFLVEHSYLAPANVLDVQPQMSSSVDNSYGTYPLNVFTTRGLYALIQGSANVLYGAFDPLSNLVAENGVPTEMGTFFLAAGALWLVTGRRLTLVSDALSRGPHKYIRACPGYKKISGDQDGVVTSPVYDMTGHVSAVEFEVFAMGNGTTIPKGRLGFNRFREELYVSNPAFDYSYVLSLKYRQWFKVDCYIRQDEAGSTILMTPAGSTTFNLMDLENETAGHVPFHLQTRPFSYGYSYSHIHRIISMMRAELDSSAGDKVVVALYGSDDLIRWNLLAYSYRTGSTPTPLPLSQVRTTSSARSWRYYTVCIGGKVKTDTELGPVVVDYTPVLRRMG